MSKLDRAIEIIERIREQTLGEIAKDIIAIEAERDEYREALEGMRDLWAREWDHEGGSTIPVEVERMFAALEGEA